MSNYGNTDQVATYLAALADEKAGYKAKIETCKTTGDEIGVQRYENRIKQVNAEIAAVNAYVDGDDDVDGPLSVEEKIGKAKKAADFDAIAADLGFEFPDDVTTNAEKKAALLELVQA